MTQTDGMRAHALLRRLVSRALLVGAALLSLSGCGGGFGGALGGPPVPSRQNDICAIFAQNPGWLEAAHASARRWGAPVSAQMAIVWRESSFRHDARPPRTTVAFGLLPWKRPSSALGYAQALDGTWDWYLQDTGRSGLWASRTEFADAIDFVGWYMAKTRTTNGVAMGDVVSHYLAYHEGHGGYRRGTYRSKDWLMRAARAVGDQARRYGRQIQSCGGDA